MGPWIMEHPWWTLVTVLALAYVLSGLRVAIQYQRAVIFRMGRVARIQEPGLYWMMSLIEWARVVDLRTVTAAVDQQETITSDNVPVKVTAVIWYTIVDPTKAVLTVRNLDSAVI